MKLLFFCQFLDANLTHNDYLKREQLCKKKINVTATLRNAPSTDAEFLVSALFHLARLWTFGLILSFCTSI